MLREDVSYFGKKAFGGPTGVLPPGESVWREFQATAAAGTPPGHREFWSAEGLPRPRHKKGPVGQRLGLLSGGVPHWGW